VAFQSRVVSLPFLKRDLLGQVARFYLAAILTLRRMRIAPIGLESTDQLAYYPGVRDDDAQFAVSVQGLGRDVFRADEGLAAIDDDNFRVHVEPWIFAHLHATLRNRGDARVVART
jgi:hypothetical protein